MLLRRRCLIAVVTAGLALSSCESSLDAEWAHTTTTQFNGNHTLALKAFFQVNTETIAVEAFADVADGTTGEVEITGPRHLLCPGTFKAHAPVDFFSLVPSSQEREWRRIANLPYFALAGDPGAITGPSGRYTVAVRLTGDPVVLATSFDAPGQDPAMYAGPENLYYKPSACVPIADSPAQRRSMLDTYMAALEAYAASQTYAANTPPALRADFLALIAKARSDVATGNAANDPVDLGRAYEAAANTLRQLAAEAITHRGELMGTQARQIADVTSDAIHLLEAAILPVV